MEKNPGALSFEIKNLTLANEMLDFQNEEKEKRADELAIANKELAFQNEEKGKLAAELAGQLSQLKALHAELLLSNMELKLVQSQLLQSEKMSAIGLLAAGIAHEINNPVGYVNSNIGTL